MRELLYTVNADRKTIEPQRRQWAGMQFEDNATVVVFDLSALGNLNALYRIDFSSAGAGYQPGANVEIIDGKISRTLEYGITQNGGEIEVTAVITMLDDNGADTGNTLTYPVLIYLTDVQRPDGTSAERNISAAEHSALDAAQRAEEAANLSEEYKEAAESAADRTEMAQRILENGTKVIFTGGNAFTKTDVNLVVDDRLLPDSTNAVENQVVHNQLTFLEARLDSETSKLAENDFVYGTSDDDVWTYKAYKNGMFECWATIKRNDVIADKEWTAGSTNHYYGVIDSVSFPVEFNKVPTLVFSIDNEFGDFLATKQNTTTTESGPIYVLALQKFEEARPVIINIMVKGIRKGVE